jgi:integrase
VPVKRAPTSGRKRPNFASLPCNRLPPRRPTTSETVNPADWRGNLVIALGRRPAVEHYDALPYSEIPAFIQALRADRGPGQAFMAAKMVELLILTAVRSNEMRGATWQEFDRPRRAREASPGGKEF